MTTPFVSVIVPTYRRSASLHEALDSVFAQTYTDFEVIVVEDGSREAVDALAPYRDRIIYLWQPNQGVGAARNAGAAKARGVWLAFLDDDDLWAPQKLERQVAEAARNAEVGLVHTDHMMLDSQGLRLARRHLPRDRVPSGWVTKELFLSNFIVISSTLVRRSEFERAGGFVTDCEVAEDIDLWLRLSRNCQVLFIRDTLTTYRDQDGSMSDGARWYGCSAKARERFVRTDPHIWQECGSLPIRRCIRDLCYRGGRGYFVHDEHAKARRMFYRAWRWLPWDWRSFAYGTLCAAGGPGRRAARTIKRLLELTRLRRITGTNS